MNDDILQEWKARVVYGDTDSVFILLPGRSRQEAHDLGLAMASTVTKENPKPVKLKFEKVYQPCVLQTKKRYVGFAYEAKEQEKPTYDAKGIETVRRDGCPAVVKVTTKTLSHIKFPSLFSFNGTEQSIARIFLSLYKKSMHKIISWKDCLKSCLLNLHPFSKWLFRSNSLDKHYNGYVSIVSRINDCILLIELHL